VTNGTVLVSRVMAMRECHQVRGAHAFVFATPRITCFPSTDLIATGHSYRSVLMDCCVFVYEIRTLNFENGIANEAIALEWVVSRAS